ncbi:DMT family transporter [Robertmurraya kyonggiensis]|uniref:EamA/RhaT family transporter n=1 Tax=Robertmurraya kyonggiensis TaxID=1037680 RepID=A0A4U1DAB9_9BACI|nr:DMT family transporter [Robertmurraya kyonggiensis]TKC18396.1 EamA/RhaT family transporter [Robertmurraya kyonggiensis]
MNRWLYAGLIVLATSLMGSSFAIGKMGLAYSSPILLVAFRFTIAGLIMGLLVKLLKRPHPKKISAWSKIALVGLFQTAGVMACIFLSLKTINAGESSILTFTNPFLVVLFGTIFVKARYRVLQWFGVTIGFIGVFITLGMSLQFEIGTILGMASAVSWAIATLLIKKWEPEFDIWVLTAYQMLFGGIILFVFSFIFEKPTFTFTSESLFILLWLAIMASIVQFGSWFTVLRKGDPGKTSAFLFLAPFFGVLSGWLLLDEALSLNVLIGGCFIFVGIFFVNWNPYLKKEKDLKKSAYI